MPSKKQAAGNPAPQKPGHPRQIRYPARHRSGSGSLIRSREHSCEENRRNSVCLSCLLRRLSEAPDDLMAWRNIMTGKSTPVCVAVALGLMACGPARPASGAPVAPVPLIFDTDMGNDVDDALALGLIHAFQRRGECRLIAVTLTNDHRYAAPFVDLVNTFYGHGEIPIGVVRGGVAAGRRQLPPATGLRGRQRAAPLSPQAARRPRGPGGHGAVAPGAGRPGRRLRGDRPGRAFPPTWPGCSTRNPTTSPRWTARRWSGARCGCLSAMAGNFAPAPASVSRSSTWRPTSPRPRSCSSNGPRRSS